jgi:hypothetical protein
MCKKHRHSSKRIEIPGVAPAPPHYYEAPPLFIGPKNLIYHFFTARGSKSKKENITRIS